MIIVPRAGSTQLELTDVPGVGRLLLWLPEVITSNTGASAVYPVGGAWAREGESLVQEIGPDACFGPGNCPRVDERTLECVGIRFPVDQPVSWRTSLRVREDGVEFQLRVTNLGRQRIERAGAAVCVSFLGAQWWHDEHVFVRSGGALCTLADLGRDAGLCNGFQMYLLHGETLDHVFYREFWGLNAHRLDVPVMVSECADTGTCVVVYGERAYALHSNTGNPCTDLLLAFGDVAPGASAEAAGGIRVVKGAAEELLTSTVISSRIPFPATPSGRR